MIDALLLGLENRDMTAVNLMLTVDDWGETPLDLAINNNSTKAVN